MVARASRADLPKTLWEQERKGEGQREGMKAGGNEREGWVEARVLPWLGVGVGLGVYQEFGLDAGMGWYLYQRMGCFGGQVWDQGWFSMFGMVVGSGSEVY